MGFLPNNNMLSYNYLNAKIKDAGGRIKIVQVKNYIGDLFVTTINQKPYVFKVVQKDIGVIDEWGIKKYRIADYSTAHYRPISDQTDKIKQLIEQEGLPKINRSLFNVMKNLGKREKPDFEKHEIEVLLDELIEAKDSKIGKLLGHESKYQQAATNVIDFLQSLNVKQIVTPLKGIAEYIEEDLIATDPAYGGDVITTHQRTDIEHKRISNMPVGPKKPWAIMLAIIFGIIIAILGIYLLYDNGTFDDLLSIGAPLGQIHLDGIGSPPPSNSANIAQKYPTPEAARDAIDRGEAKRSDFPPDILKLIDSLPKARAVTP